MIGEEATITSEHGRDTNPAHHIYYDNISRRYFEIHFGLEIAVLIQISLRFVTMDPMDNKSALVQIIAWCRTDSKIAFIWSND